MQELFLETVQLSLTGSLFALAVMLVRGIFRKAPKWLFCLLWGIVALRLLCPLSIESALSMVPDNLASGQVITSAGKDYIGEVDIIYEGSTEYAGAVESGRQPIYSDKGSYVVTQKDSYDAPPTVEETVYPILTRIWLAGVVLMSAYTAVSYALLMRKMAEATRLRDNIWQCEQADSPFVLGFFLPKIYLPYQLSDPDMAHVIAHEQAHIRRRDHWWKPIGFLLLSIHWFNPVMWVAYILLCRDIEAACDEKVIHHMEKDEIRAYSTALLHCSVHRRRIAACPLAFGEVGVKERIKRIMNYRKPAFWIILLAVIASVIAGVLLLTNPAADPDTETTAPTEDATEDTTNDPTKPPVDAALLADLTSKFSEWASPYNMALICDFASPSELPLNIYFRSGAFTQSLELTNEEWAQLPTYNPNLPCYRIPTGQIESVLYQYFGITMADLSSGCLEGFSYLESTDCYYLQTGVDYFDGFTLVSSEALEDGTIRLFYSGTYFDEHVITLRFNDDRYVMISNLPAQSESGGSWTHEAAITRFLTETNRSGQIASGGELVPPGTLPEVDSIPRADQALVGSTVSILFARQQQAIPFHYLRDAQSGTEYLTVVIPTDRIPLLIVFETNLGGAGTLCEKMSKEEPFTAKIAAFVNISFEEGMYAEMTTRYSDALDAEMVSISNPGPLNGNAYIGIYGTGDDGAFLSVMKGPQGTSVSADLQGSFDVFYRIYERFSLAALLGTESTGDATSPTEPSETVPDNQMTAEELAPFKAMLEEKASYPNMALLSLYESGREVDLGWLFSNSTDDKAGLTDAEAAFLEAKGFNFNMSIQRQSRAELDAAMIEYFGITLAESSGKSLKTFTYWEETDCYYSNYNGVNYADIQVHHGNWNENGTVSIYYTEQTSGWEMEVRLRPTNDGGYVFDYNWLNLH